MAKAKFQDTLKSGLTGVATVGKKIVDRLAKQICLVKK